MGENQMSKKDLRYDLIVIFLLFLLVCIFFWKIFLHTDQMVNFGDTTQQYYPWRVFASNMLEKGQLPLWNPYSMGGEPFLANIQTALFYPVDVLLFLIFPTHLAFGYVYLIHIFLAGLFMYIFTRYIGVDRASSFLSSIIFMYSGFLIARVYLGHYTIINAICWTPLIFLLFEIAIRKRSLFYGLLTGIPIGLQFLAGHVQFPFYTLVSLGFYLFIRFFWIVKKKNFCCRDIFKLFLIFILAVVIGVSLSAIQFIPSLELSNHITRQGGVSYDFSTACSFPPQNLITFILPNFFGNPVKNTYWNPYSCNYGELSIYLGILPLLLIFIAIYFKRKNLYVLSFLSLTIILFLLALGKYTPVYWFFWKFFPGFDLFRVPSRFMFLFTFFASILAGFGFAFLKERLDLDKRKKIWNLIRGLGVLIWILILIIIVFFASKNQITAFGKNVLEQSYLALDNPIYSFEHYAKKIYTVYYTIAADLFILLLLSLGCLALFIFRIKKVAPFKYFNVVILLFVLLNLWFYNIGFIEVEEPIEIYSEPNYISFLKNNSGINRIYDADNKILPNFQMMYKLRTLKSCNPLKLKKIVQITERIHNLSNNNNHPLLDLLNIKYILTSSKLNNSGFKLVFNSSTAYVYENIRVLPKAFVLYNVEIGSELEILKKLKDENFNPLDAVLLEQQIDNPLVERRGFEKMEFQKYAPNEIIIHPNITNPGLLVLSEVYYPEWKVYVDGELQEMHISYHALRSVYLDNGYHVVRFIYEPNRLKLGFWITVITALLLISVSIIYFILCFKI